MSALMDVWREALRITLRNKAASLLSILILIAGLAGCIFGIGMGASLMNASGSVIPSRLHSLGTLGPTGLGGLRGHEVLSLRQRQLPELAAMSAVRSAQFNVYVADVAGGGRSLSVDGAWIDQPIFTQLNWPMALGRDFVQADFAASSTASQASVDDIKRSGSVLVGEQFWRTVLAANPKAIGTSLRIDGAQHTIVGVLPEGRAFPFRQQIYLPFQLSPSSALMPRVMGLFAIIEPAQLQTVQSTLELMQAERVKELGPIAKNTPLKIQSFFDANNSLENKIIFQTLSVVGFLVLLLAATNVGGLLLVNWLARSQENATRTALGCTRARLGMASVTQASLLVLIALTLTIITMNFGLPWFETYLHQAQGGIPLYMHLNFKTSMILPVALVSLVTVAAVAFPVYWHLREAALMRGLRVGERGNSSPGKLGLVLLGLQCALSVAAVMIALLCARGANHAMTRSYGIQAPQVVVTRIMSSDLATQEQAARKLLSSLRAHADVLDVSVSVGIPHAMLMQRDLQLPASKVDVDYVPADRKFAELYGIKLRRGRWFTDADEGRDVVIIDPATALTAFKTEEAIGRTLNYIHGDGKTLLSATVIGVTDPVGLDLEQGPDQPSMFVPMLWNSGAGVSFAIRTRASDPASFLPTLARLGVANDQRVALLDSKTYLQAFQQNGSGFRLLSGLFAPMGLLALLLAGVGLAALLGALVARRMRQSAIRRALGANTVAVLTPLLRPLFVTAFIGLTIGALLATPLGVKMSDVLYGGENMSIQTVLSTLAVVIAGLIAASVLPARRALKVNPNIVLKQE
jgi:putative ABC transport system permease protein